MTGYVRVDTSNNIADGNVISAADLDNEFDGIQAAFNASTGHNHDGTTGEGAPISVLGPTQDIVVSASTVLPKTTNTVDIGSSSLKFKDLYLAGNASIAGTLGVTGVATLTANPVMSGGTANGVAYLDGSKVLTTGSALTFDGTSLTNTAGPIAGAGFTSRAFGGEGGQISLQNPTNTGDVATFDVSSATTARLFTSVNNSSLLIGQISGTGGTVALYTATAERMRITATGEVGVGTTTPVAQLGVVGAGQTTAAMSTSSSLGGTLYVRDSGAAAGSGGAVMFGASQGAFAAIKGLLGDGANNTIGALAFSTRNATTDATLTERLRITNAGNVGIGTSSPATRLHVADNTSAGVIQLGGTSTTGYYAQVNQNGNNFQIIANGDQAYRASLGTNNGTGYITFLTANLTTGNTERMRIDAAGNVGIGTSSPGAKLMAYGASGTSVSLNNSATGTTGTSGFQLQIGATTDAYVWNYSNGPLVFATNNAEQMRLTTTGLGIGVTSPGAKLDLAAGTGASVTAVLVRSAAANANGFQIVTDSTTDNVYLNNFYNAALRFGTNNTERMRLDASGNLGIGTSSPNTRLTIGGYSSANQTPDIQITRSSSGTAIQTGPNITFSDGTTNNTTTLQVTQGRFGVWNYGGGSWIERLSVDASGNLGLGVTPSAWGSTSTALQNRNASFWATSAAAYLGYNYFFDGSARKYIASSFATEYTQLNGQHIWYTAPSGTAGNAITFTQAMTLDASGNLLVGTTSSGGKFTAFEETTATTTVGRFVQSNAGAATNGALQAVSAATGGSALDVGHWNGVAGNWVQRWYNNSQRIASGNVSAGANFLAGVDALGNLLVGTTSVISSGKISVQATSTNPGIVAKGQRDCFQAQTTQTSGTSYFGYWIYNGTNVGAITSTGTTTSYVTSSDYRLKENIQPMTGALAKVAALKPVTYTWKADGSSGEGFIAHELAEVCPAAVTGEKDAVDADGKPQYQGIDVSFLVGTLTAAIQELKAEFDAYKASHP